MKGTAQQIRTTNRPPRGAGSAPVQARGRVGSGNRHRANALQLQSHDIDAPLTRGGQPPDNRNTFAIGQPMFSNQQVLRSAAGILQRKLTIGKANDQYEQEADRVADKVMRMPAGDHVAGLDCAAPGSAVQRKCSCGTTAGGTGGCDPCRKKRLSLKQANASLHETADVPARVHEVLRSSGQPLDAATRAFMEPRFGYDFREVRLHTNSTAADSASAVNALAYTVGNHIAFGSGQYAPGTTKSNRLLAHELAHVVQQGGAGSRSMQGKVSQWATTLDEIGQHSSSVSGVIQRAGDPLLVPDRFPCPTDFTPGAPAGPDLLFGDGKSAITDVHTTQLTTFVAAWVAAGGTDDILVHGYASTTGEDGPNWTLSCERAQHTRDELLRLGVPSAHISIVAHGESTDFGASNAANQHAVVSSSPASFLSLPFGILTPEDNFGGRSNKRFGVGEVINLDFFSFPPRPAADFGGMEWLKASGGGVLYDITPAGTAIYIAPSTADTVTLELRVVSGPTAGRVVDTRVITIVEPGGLRLVPVAGSFPDFGGWDAPTIPAGTWGVGFKADEFIDPKDVSFEGVVFGEGSAVGVVTPAGSFLRKRSGVVHRPNTHGFGQGGNATTGTPVSQDGINFVGEVHPRTVQGVKICGISDFLWPIPWEFRVYGGPRTRFATANQHLTSSTLCNATVEKAGAGPFCRRIDGTTC